MNRIVLQHFPASKLPDEMRGDVDPSSTVTVTIEEEKPPVKVSLDEIWARRRPPFRTAEEIDEDLRRQRDEWDD